jgi:hypothetical protein
VIPDGETLDPGSRDKHPESATLLPCICYLSACLSSSLWRWWRWSQTGYRWLLPPRYCCTALHKQKVNVSGTGTEKQKKFDKIFALWRIRILFQIRVRMISAYQSRKKCTVQCTASSAKSWTPLCRWMLDSKIEPMPVAMPDALTTVLG